jgi:lipocalin
MSKNKIISILIIAAILFNMAGKVFAECKDTVMDLDLQQYSGVWYEIARLPNKHEKDMVEVTSTFNKIEDGKYQIVNKGYKKNRNGKPSVVKGVISFPEERNRGFMKVRVLWMSIVYKIIDIDHKGYEYAMVTSDSNKYLWILSKSPLMDDAVYDKLVRTAKNKGFNTDALEKVSQSYNISVYESNRSTNHG